jgi:hypothetical protein
MQTDKCNILYLIIIISIVIGLVIYLLNKYKNKQKKEGFTSLPTDNKIFILLIIPFGIAFGILLFYYKKL